MAAVKPPVAVQATTPGPQNNPNPSPFIADDPLDTTMAVRDAAEITRVSDANEVNLLNQNAPAFIEAARTGVRAHDLLAETSLDGYIKIMRSRIRTDLFANAGIDSQKYSAQFVLLVPVRAMVMVEYNMQLTKSLARDDAVKTISSAFKSSSLAKNLDTKRADARALQITEAKAIAAEKRKAKRVELAARNTIVGQFFPWVLSRMTSRELVFVPDDRFARLLHLYAELERLVRATDALRSQRDAMLENIEKKL
ncbi:hypothetical protein T492DRAFT_840405 [Pavlovales sp. CCMP2436]|nr:hypothetical protein T492DRAFT_840405 [Pavlovales sp. CCMP2436]